MQQENQLLWFYERMNAEGRETLLKIARSFVATGAYSRVDEMSEDLKKHLAKYEADIDKWMNEDF